MSANPSPPDVPGEPLARSQPDGRHGPDGAARRGLGELRRVVDRLEGRRQELERRRDELAASLDEVNAFLTLAPDVQARLEALSQDLFGDILDRVETYLTHAIGDVLGQPRQVKATRELHRNRMQVTFSIEHDGQSEDIIRGQGGSVANILSVGLRLIGLTCLPEDRHRRFLVLDEQDCWLRPHLVPRLMQVIWEIATTVGFQVLVISHHDHSLFLDYADRVYELRADADDPSQVAPYLIHDATATASADSSTNDDDPAPDSVD